MHSSSETGGSVADRLKQWRESYDLTLREVGERAGEYLGGDPVPVATVANYERRSGPTLPFLVALSRAFWNELDLYWLLHGEPKVLRGEDTVQGIFEIIDEGFPDGARQYLDGLTCTLAFRVDPRGTMEKPLEPKRRRRTVRKRSRNTND